MENTKRNISDKMAKKKKRRISKDMRTHKPEDQDISIEDREVILALNLIKTMAEVIVKNIQEAVDEVQAVKIKQDEQNAKLQTYFISVLNAINRLEAKIAASGDTTPIIEALAPIKQSFIDTSAELEVKIAEVEVV